MGKYDSERSIQDEHRNHCDYWKLAGGNDFVDEALRLADEQVEAGNVKMPTREELAKLTKEFLAKGGKIKVVEDAQDSWEDLLPDFDGSF